MIIKNFIDRLRRKGYDDFYLADLANKWDGAIMLLLCIIQFMIIMFLCISPFLLLGKDWTKYELFGASIITWMGAAVIVFMISWVPDATIRESKEKGETDLRISYMFGSFISKFALKAIRYAPAVSAILLVISYVVSLFIGGFNLVSLIALVVSGVLLLATSRFYHKMLAKIGNEASFYVDWKTDQNVEHFDELVSRHEKWWIPSASLDFEKFNIDKYRSIRVASIVGTFACLLTGFIYALGVSPLIGTYMQQENVKRNKVQVTQHVDSVETRINSSAIPSSDDIVEETKAEENQDVTDNETDESEESVVNQSLNTSAIYLTSELDKLPTYSGSDNYKTGIQNYVLSKIPQLNGMKAYIEFCVNERGKIYNVDTSLISDDALAQEVIKVLESMPPMMPGEINGEPVCFKGNIEFR